MIKDYEELLRFGGEKFNLNNYQMIDLAKSIKDVCSCFKFEEIESKEHIESLSIDFGYPILKNDSKSTSDIISFVIGLLQSNEKEDIIESLSKIVSERLSTTDGIIIHDEQKNVSERKKTAKTFTIDFDNTCALEVFPGIGEDVKDSVRVLKKMQDFGHHLILWTCRCGSQLRLAEKWFENNGIKIEAVNDFIYDDANIELVRMFGCPRKVIGDYNIDDKNFGCPITQQKDSDGKIYNVVDWKTIEKKLKKIGLLNL